MMALSGVRNSWLTLARNSDLERLAMTACSQAFTSSSSCCFWAVRSLQIAM